MLASERIVFLEAKLFGRVLRVLDRVVGTVTRSLADETDELSL